MKLSKMFFFHFPIDQKLIDNGEWKIFFVDNVEIKSLFPSSFIPQDDVKNDNVKFNTCSYHQEFALLYE